MGGLTALFARALAMRRRFPGPTARGTRFSLSLLTGFLVASGAAMLLLYALSSGTLERETLSLHRALLEQASRSMDASFLQVDAFVQQLAIDPYLANFPDFYRRGDFTTLLRVNEDLNNLRIINAHVHSVEVYFVPTRQVFIPNTGVLSVDAVADAPFLRAVASGAIHEGWQAARTIHDALSDKDLSVVSVVKFLRQGSAEPDSFMVVNIGEDFLRELAGVVRGSQDTELLITDAAGVTIAQLSDRGYFAVLRDLPPFAHGIAQGDTSMTLRAGTRYLVTVVRGTLQDWRYVSILPFPAITAPIRFLRTWSLLVIFAGLIASLAVALLFSRRLNALLRQVLVRAVPGGHADDRGDPLTAIESSLASLNAQTRELERGLETHLPVLRNNALEGLFKGRISGGEAPQETLRAYGLSLGRRQWYVALVASLGGEGEALSERDLAAVRIVDCIRSAVPHEHEFAAAFTRDDEIALLVGFDAPGGGDGPGRACDHLAGAVSSRMGDLLDASRGAPIILGMSAAHEGLASLPAAYREARGAARSAASASLPIVRFEEMSAADGRAGSFPFDEEADLIASLGKGDVRAVERAHAGFEKALAGRTGSWQHYHLLSSLLKAAHDMGISPGELFGEANPWLSLPAAIDAATGARFLRDLSVRIAEKVRQRKASRNRQAAEKVAAHVRAHFGESLNLLGLSRLVFMSGPYLSRVFHEEMKISLKHYIGAVRLEKARELLRDPRLKVGEVGRRVGYGKPRGFLKFFKEQAGMTPLEYRASLGKASAEAADRSARSFRAAD